MSDYLTISRKDFPKDFVFGCATAAYQDQLCVEGGYNADGKGTSNWDAYTLNRPERIQDGSNGCDAIDQYNKYKEDIIQIKKLGLDAYRFSICWSRILPGGRLCSGVNRKGVKYYNDLIDFCLAQGIEPYVTIFHFDLPNCLEEEYGGFLSSKIMEDFGEYAEVCFWEFGDRVKHWITINEAWTFTHNGYVAGNFPPGHGVTSNEHLRSLRSNVVMHRGIRLHEAGTRSLLSNPVGDPSTEPYIVAHNLILSHATAVDIYRKRFQSVQGGKIGITNMTTWYEPLNEKNPSDVAAASRAVDFMWGWFNSPIVHGDYPPIMRKLVGKRLPNFTPEETKLVKGSYDFIGLNYYTTYYATNSPTPSNTKPTYLTDQQVQPLTEKNGVPIGEMPGSDWLFVVPRGIYALLAHTKDKYNDPLIYITENGVSEKNNPRLTVTKACKDEVRANYYQDHLKYAKQAIDYGVNVKAYFLWSMFDNYEWSEGYTARFGIFYVDFVNKLARYPKSSAIWWMNFLNKNVGTPRLKRQVEGSEEHDSVKKLKA